MNTTEQLLKTVTHDFTDTGIIEWEDIPSIDLYMDQVTTFMDAKLIHSKRYPEDKILTKTMINNYAKAKIFPAPIKKKYTKNHIMLLIMLYHLKTILSIRDITLILQPATLEWEKNEHAPMLKEVYLGFVALQKRNMEQVRNGISENFQSVFENKDFFEEYDKPNIKGILSVLLLAIHANTEKRLAEKIIDFIFIPEKNSLPKSK